MSPRQQLKGSATQLRLCSNARMKTELTKRGQGPQWLVFILISHMSKGALVVGEKPSSVHYRQKSSQLELVLTRPRTGLQNGTAQSGNVFRCRLDWPYTKRAVDPASHSSTPDEKGPYNNRVGHGVGTTRPVTNDQDRRQSKCGFL